MTRDPDFLCRSLDEGEQEGPGVRRLGIRTKAQAERSAALKTKLDKAVTDGKLTQADADAVTKGC